MEISNQQLIAGLIWNWNEVSSDYPAPDYYFQLVLKLTTRTAVTITSTADGSEHNFAYTSAQSGALPEGDYNYHIIAVDSSDATKKYLIDSGIKAINSLLTVTTDPRGYWQLRLADLRTAYEEAAVAGFASLTVNGRQVTYDRKQLLAELNYAESRAEQEARQVSGKKKNRTFLVRFS